MTDNKSDDISLPNGVNLPFEAYSHTITLDLVQPTGYGTAADFSVDDVIALVQYDVATPTTATATVTATDTAARTVTTGALSGGIPAGTLNLEFASSPTTATAHQQLYCYVAQDDDLIGFAVNVTSRQFAP